MPKMQKVKLPPNKRRNVISFLGTLLIIAADQLSKTWIRSNLALGQSIPPTGLFRLTYIRNTGAGFGLFQEQTLLLTIAASIGLVVLIILSIFASSRFPSLNNRIGRLSLTLLLGGTAGNLIDRLRFGYVTDFIDIGIWPAFNIADSAITIGVILLAYSVLFRSPTKQHRDGQ